MEPNPQLASEPSPEQELQQYTPALECGEEATLQATQEDISDSRCQSCGKKFAKIRLNQRYCSARCRCHAGDQKCLDKVSEEELELCRNDPLREGYGFVVCRECKAKLQRLKNHIPIHNITLEEYCEKWNDPPLVSQDSRDKSQQSAIDWAGQHGGDHFGGKGHKLLPGERGRRGKPATSAMRRGWRKHSEKRRGIPQALSCGKAPDTSIVLAKLAGKSNLEIAHEVGRSDAAVGQRLEDLGCPPGECRFLHGEPLAKKHFDDLCKDFGLTAKEVIRVVRENRGTGSVPCSKFFDKYLTKHLSRLDSQDVLLPRFADVVVDLRNRWTKKFCVKSSGGEQIRTFLASEIRDLRELSEQLKQPVSNLQDRLQNQNSTVHSHEILTLADLQWICDRARLEVVGKIGGRGFRALMFLWPVLKDLNDKRPGLLVGSQSVNLLVDELLSLDYDTTPGQIHCAATGELSALDPQSLRKEIMEELAARRAARQASQRALLAEAQRTVTQLRAELSRAEAKLDRLRHNTKSEDEKQTAVLGLQVDSFIPKYEELFSLPDIKRKPRLLFDGWTHPNFSQTEITAARNAVISRASLANRPTVAARWLVSIKTGVSFDTVAWHHKTYKRQGIKHIDR